MLDSTDLRFWDKMKYLFTNPNLFFNAIKNEKNIKNSWIIYSIATILFYFAFSYLTSSLKGEIGNFLEFFYLISLPTMLMLFPGGIFWPIFEPTFSQNIYLHYSIYFLIFLIFSFFYSGVMHLILFLFKRNIKYKDTYNIVTYSMIPFLIFNFIPLIGGTLSIFYLIILTTIGISKVHGISKIKSAFACILPLILEIILASVILIDMGF
jgi:hypothetical protein